MTSKAINPKEGGPGATHWRVYDDDPRVDWAVSKSGSSGGLCAAAKRQHRYNG